MKKTKVLFQVSIILLGVVLIGSALIREGYFALLKEREYEQSEVISRVLELAEGGGQEEREDTTHLALIREELERLNGGQHRIVEVLVLNQRRLGSDLYHYEVDVITEHQQLYDWLRIEILIRGDTIAYMERVSISFLDRLQGAENNEVHNAVNQVVQEAFEQLRTADRSLFGLNLRGQTLGGQGIEEIEIVSMELVGQASDGMEQAVLVRANITVFNRIQKREMLLYLRKYEGKWQIEEMKGLNVR